jgi:hypothetical protein
MLNNPYILPRPTTLPCCDTLIYSHTSSPTLMNKTVSRLRFEIYVLHATVQILSRCQRSLYRPKVYPILHHGCHKGRFWRKITIQTSADIVRTSARVCIYPADAILSADRFLPSADAVKTASTRTLGWVRTDASTSPPLSLSLLPPPLPPLPPSLPLLCYPRGRWAASVWTRNFFFYGFQSPKSPKSPKSPNSPSSMGFAGEAVRRRRFFWPSSPSHPSKLYSSLGWLNSKVPKPFPPFSLRLIDVDGF